MSSSTQAKGKNRMKKQEFVPIAVTLGRNKIGELLVSVEMADDLRFNPWLPDEPELPDGEADEPASL